MCRGHGNAVAGEDKEAGTPSDDVATRASTDLRCDSWRPSDFISSNLLAHAKPPNGAVPSFDSNTCLAGEAESASAKVADLEALVQEREGLIARLEEDLLAAKPGSRAESTEATFLGTADRPEAGGEARRRRRRAMLLSDRGWNWRTSGAADLRGCADKERTCRCRGGRGAHNGGCAVQPAGSLQETSVRVGGGEHAGRQVMCPKR